MVRTDEQVTKEIAGRIRAERQAKDMSQAELAGLAHMTIGAVSAIERSARLPSIISLIRIARALGVQPAALLDTADNIERQKALAARMAHLTEVQLYATEAFLAAIAKMPG